MPIPSAAQDLFKLAMPFRDDTGRIVRLSDWRGRDAIVAMEYSTCTFMCSTTVYKLRQTQAAADARRKDMDFIVISLDPRHDTPASWQDYRRQRELLRDNWHFLTPAEQHVPAIARLLDIRYWYDGPHLLHDFRLLRMDREGTVVRSVSTYSADVATLLD